MANYRGISLLVVCSKVYIVVLHQRMQLIVEAILSELQMGGLSFDLHHHWCHMGALQPHWVEHHPVTPPFSLFC
jgi:hypothetical protein